MGKLITSISAGSLFPEKPTIHFYPEISLCPECGASLRVLKTSTKTVVTMDIGPFNAKETVLFCPCNGTTFHSGQLRRLVPDKGTFGFDVIVEIGNALWVRSRNNQEVIAELAGKNIEISERGISNLGRKFIIYLALAHQESQYQLRNLLNRKGGYILHVDGTCEGDSPNLFCGLDGISELVLDTIKIPSEKKDQLVPFFQRIKEKYGAPKALVHDMGRGIVKAVEEVFPEVADFICHFHFLRDVGKDLLLADYNALRKRITKLNVRSSLRQKAKYLEQKINPTSQEVEEITTSIESGSWQVSSLEHIPMIMTYALIHWAFKHTGQSGGYGFPFDRQHLDFYRRLQKVHLLLGEIKDVKLRGCAKDNKPFLQIQRALTQVVEDKRLNDLAADLERKSEVFDKLRAAMRIALPESKDGLNDNGGDEPIKTIEEKVVAFRNWLVSDGNRRKTYSSMITQLDKYWEKLFADPLEVVTAEGTMHIQPQRTNNILERFFRGEKRRGRRKNGMLSLNKVLKTVLADTPLVQNLKNNGYMDIILDGCMSLEERFSKIDSHLVHKEMEKAKDNSEKILPAVKRLIKDSDLTTKISALFAL